MGSTTKVKVAEIFTQAGAAFSRLGELTMQLQSTAEADGTPKWTDEEIDMLNIAITRFCSDLTEISLRVKQRGVSQLKQTLKKKIYEDAGIAVKQIAIQQQQSHRAGAGPPPIVLGAADILATSPQQFAQLQQLQHQQVIQQQQQQLQQQQFLQHQPQQLQLHPANTVIQHPIPQQQQQQLQQQQSPLLQPQHIFISHIPATAATGAISSSNNQFTGNLPNAGLTTVFAASNHQQHIQHPTLPIIISHQHQQQQPQQPPPAMMMTLNRLNASTPSALMMEPSAALLSGVVVELDDDDDDNDEGAGNEDDVVTHKCPHTKTHTDGRNKEDT